MTSVTQEAPPSPSSYLTLQAIDDNVKSPPTIVVRLIHSWEPRDFKRNNLLLSVDFLLVDEEVI